MAGEADYAVVVGVGRYPDLLGKGVAADLEGPDHDAAAVHDWLVSAEGGGLPRDNVKLIRSADFDPLDPEDPQPAAARIERALTWIEEQTVQAAGRRLYLYFSGHGFSPELEEGALFTADATHRNPTYVYAHAWLRWFRKAQRFSETVLWMDCCMNQQQSIPVREIGMRPEVGTSVPGPSFIALAAQNGKALEHEMPDGRVHGVFTWALLKGLEGGAANDEARVTGESLRTFLHTVMPDFLPDEVKDAAEVDLQPFVRADEGMVFRRLPERPRHRVHMRLPGAEAGQELRLWTGRPHRQVASEVLAGEEWTGSLVRGLYVVDVPAAGLRQGFQVGGAGDVVGLVIDRQGPAVIAYDGTEKYALEVLVDNPAATIVVTDDRFQRIFTETGAFDERATPGVCKVRVEFGRDISTVAEEVLLVDRDMRGHRAVAPLLPSPAPIPGTALTHESHVGTFAAAAAGDASGGPHAGEAVLSILGRFWTAPAEVAGHAPDDHPLHGLDLLASDGSLVAHLSEHCRLQDQDHEDPIAVWEERVPPGVYTLRQSLGRGGGYEAALVASRGWVTQVALRRAEPDLRTGADIQAPLISDAAIFMRRSERSGEERGNDPVIEGARLALMHGRDVLGDGRGGQLRELLLTGIDDPIAAIIGSHLLLRAIDLGATEGLGDAAAAFDAAVERLRTLVGRDHPDVEALSLRCTDPALRATEPFRAPPMFISSWRLLTDATYGRPELVPIALWERVHASTSVGPFLVWAIDEAAREAHAQQLAHWIAACADEESPPLTDDETAEAAEGAAEAGVTDGVAAALRTAADSSGATPLSTLTRDAARKLHLPASAAAGLWEQLGLERSGGPADRRPPRA